MSIVQRPVYKRKYVNELYNHFAQNMLGDLASN